MQLKSYQNLANDDSFVFYYTGHGGQIDDTNIVINTSRDIVFTLSLIRFMCRSLCCNNYNLSERHVIIHVRFI